MSFLNLLLSSIIIDLVGILVRNNICTVILYASDPELNKINQLSTVIWMGCPQYGQVPLGFMYLFFLSESDNEHIISKRMYRAQANL